MRNFKIIIIPFVCIFFFLQCRKENEKDTISKQTLNGMVYNNCTDSGLAGVKVYFETFKQNAKISSSQAVSGPDGNFIFSDAEIHSSDIYTYALYIPTISGIGANIPELTRFDGTTMYFTKDQAGTFFKPRVTPGFYNLCFVVKPNVFVNNPDSICVKFQQAIFHKNVPSLPYSSLRTHLNLQNGNVSCIANYPMGLWRLTIDKWKNNVYSIVNDSTYIGYGGTKTYTINW